MKLTKAQAEVLDWAKSKIDYARTHDLVHYVAKYSVGRDLEIDWDAHPNPYLSNAEVLREAMDVIEKDNFPTVINGAEIFPAGYYKSMYERTKDGETIIYASSNTLNALQRMGLIEVIKDGKRSCDMIRVLNY